MRIVPAILAKDARDFRSKLRAIDGAAEFVQVDVMDGSLVRTRSWYEAKTVARINTDMRFELHLMVRDPLAIVIDWMKVKGFTRAIVHLESLRDLRPVIQFAKERCIHVGIAISPKTSLRRLTPYIKNIEEIIVMGNTPGRSGLILNPETLKTVRTLRRRYPRLPIGFDIGVNAATIPALRRAGVTIGYAASAIFASNIPPQHALQQLQALTEQPLRSS
jgi:ribulose-phosphate 3-epimerase